MRVGVGEYTGELLQPVQSAQSVAAERMYTRGHYE